MPADPQPTKRILLYEDDRALAQEIVAAFAEVGAPVEIADSAEDVAERFAGGRVSVLVMDRMIGPHDSLALLPEMRARGERVPVLVISSLSSVDERIRGLKQGGDDYLVKPFAMGELIARVEALARRTETARASRLRVGSLQVDLIERTVIRGDREVDLSPREFALLEYLMRHAGQVVTRTMLLEDVWNYRNVTQTNVVDVHIGNLRRKIDFDGEDRLITSVRGVGFKMSAHDEST